MKSLRGWGVGLFYDWSDFWFRYCIAFLLATAERWFAAKTWNPNRDELIKSWSGRKLNSAIQVFAALLWSHIWVLRLCGWHFFLLNICFHSGSSLFIHLFTLVLCVCVCVCVCFILVYFSFLVVKTHSLSCCGISRELNHRPRGCHVTPEWRIFTTVVSLGTADWLICNKLKMQMLFFRSKHSFTLQRRIRAMRTSAGFHVSNYSSLDPVQLCC